MQATGLPGDAVAVAGVGVEEHYFSLLREPAEPPYVLSVGTVEARKDLATVVRMLVHDPQLRLLAAGFETAYATELRLLAAGLGVGERFQLLGYVSDERLRELYRGARAMVFPSRYEGFGLPPLQAQAAGVPVVASDIPVLREVLGEGAWFVRPGDSLQFARSVAEIAAGGGGVEQRVQSARERARQFSWSAVAERTALIYRSLCQ